jgi:hypothetical protein
MTSGRSLPRKGADWSRASERYKETVRTMMIVRVRTPSGPVRTCGLHPRPDSKRVSSGPPVCPNINVDRPDAPH